MRLTKAARAKLTEQEQQELDLKEQERLAALPRLLLSLCARAEKLGVRYKITEVPATKEDETKIIYVRFRGEFQDLSLESDVMSTAASWEVDSVMYDLNRFEEEQMRYAAKMALRREVLARLTPAEKDALGVDE